jgi:hypothetical protein
MLALGTVWIGKYRVWSTKATSVFKPDPINTVKQPYYNVLLTYEENQDIHYYINLMKDEGFGSFRFLFNVDDRGNPTKDTDDGQYQAYLERKSMGQPMWKLSENSLHMLFAALLDLSGEYSDI